MNAARLDALVRYVQQTEHLPKPWYRRLTRWWAMRQIDKSEPYRKVRRYEHLSFDRFLSEYEDRDF
jgi:hypothetical protein